jgi:hypothetical protein
MALHMVTWCGDNKGDRGKFLGKFYIVCLIATFLITVRSLKLYSTVLSKRAGKNMSEFSHKGQGKISDALGESAVGKV